MGENRLERKRRGDQRKEEVKSVKRVGKKKKRARKLERAPKKVGGMRNRKRRGITKKTNI